MLSLTGMGSLLIACTTFQLFFSFVGTEEYLAPEVVAGTGHNATVDWWTFGILLYEMIYGTTPFRGTTRDDTFTNIRKTYIDFPEYEVFLCLSFSPSLITILRHKRGGVSKECKKLLKHLLERDPTKRLGAVGGATDIKGNSISYCSFSHHSLTRDL